MRLFTSSNQLMLPAGTDGSMPSGQENSQNPGSSSLPVPDRVDFRQDPEWIAMTERVKALETRRQADPDTHLVECCAVCGSPMKDKEGRVTHKNGFCPETRPVERKKTLSGIKFGW